ncbi:hypothetical protein LCGC14_1251240 [marine sediment metagenome]|uniref:Uncharacterized protein n=1 Tax=marine sediment metagenome TaxID=412755 RepID=A0A0F9LPR3_9ZZZZ
MKLYVVYHIKGNKASNDIILEIPDEDIDHHRSIRPGYQGCHGQAQWKWTERNIDVVKERITESEKGLLVSEIVLYSVQQIV